MFLSNGSSPCHTTNDLKKPKHEDKEQRGRVKIRVSVHEVFGGTAHTMYTFTVDAVLNELLTYTVLICA